MLTDNDLLKIFDDDRKPGEAWRVPEKSATNKKKKKVVEEPNADDAKTTACKKDDCDDAEGSPPARTTSVTKPTRRPRKPTPDYL